MVYTISMADIVSCQHCAAKNRLTPSPEGQVPVCGRCATVLPWVVTATDASFQQELHSAIPVLVDFWAPWCGPCRLIAPVLEDLSRELAGQLKVVKLNVDENPVTSEVYRVQSIPLLILLRNSELVDSIVGAMPKAALLERLRPHM